MTITCSFASSGQHRQDLRRSSLGFGGSCCATVASGPCYTSDEDGKDATVGRRQVVTALLEQHGRTYSEELGIRLETNTPSALFCWLCAALLFSARISAGLGCRAAAALIRQG
jgi:hypothetical protein